MMKVLVTGGTGFIGSYLVEELLKDGYEVRILSRKSTTRWKNKVEIFRGDITKPEILDKAFKGIDAVFHNAAYAMDSGKKEIIYDVNVNGTKNVAEACIRNDIHRIVYTSSAGVYGFPKTNKTITEDFPKKPMNAYQKSKLLGEKILKECEDIRTSIVRPPLVFGAGGQTTKILLDMLTSKSMVLIGDGNNIISIVHPADVARCLRLALERDNRGEIFNVVSFTVKIREFIEKLAERLEIEKPEKRVPFWIAYIIATLHEFISSNPKITRFRVKTLASNRIISCEKARRVLGYKPTFDLEKTIEDMIRWYNQSKKK